MDLMFILATIIVTLLLIVAGIHLYWAAGGLRGKMAAIPQINGFPAFLPSSGATLVAALFLSLCAILIASDSTIIPLLLPRVLENWLMYGLSLGFALRAMGDFRLVGFFKRVRGSRFAKLDTFVFSPFCVVLAIAVFLIAFSGNK
jgi:Protein of unknown function (DUF3995)